MRPLMLSDTMLLILLYVLVVVRLVLHFTPRHPAGAGVLRQWGEETIDSLVPAGVTALAVIAFLVRPYYIPSGSMEHTLEIHDLILVNKAIYRVAKPNRGDIVVFHKPGDAEDQPALIKRVVGVAGDVLDVKDGKLWRNGQAIDEPYLHEPIEELGIFHGPVLVKPGHLFMMGDNRNNSSDSRVWGQLPLANVLGRAEAIVWPWKPFRVGLLKSQQGMAEPQGELKQEEPSLLTP